MLITIASLLIAGLVQDQPAPAAAPAEPAPVENPTLPTTGDGATILTIVEKICQPAVRGQGFETTAPALGFKKNKRDNTWAMPLGGDKNYQVILQPQGSNKDVCQAEVRYAIGGEAPITEALNVWSFLHQPPLKLGANYVNVDPDGVKRTRKSWEHYDQSASTAVNFSVMRKPDDSPLNAKYDTGMLFYQERKF